MLKKVSERKIHAATRMNSNSSRSHTVFKLFVGTAALTIVDLAGSERTNRTEARGQQLIEACKINGSLYVLGKCFMALRTGKGTVPVRESKLTMLFQEFFMGCGEITMITNINPLIENLEESVRTLNYSNLAKDIRIEEKVEKVKKFDELLREKEDIVEEYRRKSEEIARRADEMELKLNENVREIGDLKSVVEQLKEKLESYVDPLKYANAQQFAIENNIQLLKKVKKMSKSETVVITNPFINNYYHLGTNCEEDPKKKKKL